jgi:hypothetical protein
MKASLALNHGKWYIGTMNDGLFIINRPPRPAPVDYLTAGDPDLKVIASMGNDKLRTEAIVKAHNEVIEQLRELLTAYRAKRAVDGGGPLFKKDGSHTPRRTWDAGMHYDADILIETLEAKLGPPTESEIATQRDRVMGIVQDTLNPQVAIGSWQCQHCHLRSMYTWRGQPSPDNAPSCCFGELMLPYRISSEYRASEISTNPDACNEFCPPVPHSHAPGYPKG